MVDYIRREDYCEENCGKENREGYKTCTNCGMLNVPSADVQPVDRWISVDEALPIYDGLVLAVDKNNTIRLGIYTDLVIQWWHISHIGCHYHNRQRRNEMREILFRGKSGDGWHYGLLTKYGNHKWRVIEEDNNMVTVKTNTIGQYTGLTDKNGTKIFEGDIVRIGRYFNNNFPTEDNYVCKYDTHTASFKFYYIVPKDISNVNKYAVLGDGTTISVFEHGLTIEVVSTIYDNTD